MATEPLHVTDESFQTDVLEADVPVLLDFWAPWCGPCRMLGPVIEELATDFEGRAVVAKLNTDENGDAPRRYNVMGIPTMIVFKNGEEVERLVGVRPKQAIAEKLDAHIAPAE
jgi:thioredoxin 1